MTYSTENFQAGSEFRVQWVVFTVKRNSKYGETISHKSSDIFDSYEKAEAFRQEVRDGQAFVTVRLPGNKNFRTARDTKKI